jgi:hypothetical protein
MGSGYRNNVSVESIPAVRPAMSDGHVAAKLAALRAWLRRSGRLWAVFKR